MPYAALDEFLKGRIASCSCMIQLQTPDKVPSSSLRIRETLFLSRAAGDD